MGTAVIELPFEHLGYGGTVEVRFGPNRSARRSGFDALQGLGLNPARCLGYPTLRARVRRYGGSGYRTALAWIQMIEGRRYARPGDAEPARVALEPDVSPQMLALGVPFFAHGYPAALYDAPCDNLGDAARLDWLASTFLVTFPSRMNGNVIRYLTGFSWGYSEWDSDGERQLSLRPPEALGSGAWQAMLPTLRATCPRWSFA